MPYDENFLDIQAVALSSTPEIESVGDDTNIGMNLRCKGTVPVLAAYAYRVLLRQLSENNPTMLDVQGGPSNVNYFLLVASDTGQPITLQAAGTDANVHVNVLPLGTGRLQENGVAVVLGATGSTDNAIVRADGTGTKTVQGGTDAPTYDDSGNMQLGGSTLTQLRPQTTEKVDLGSASQAFHDAHLYGKNVLGAAGLLTISTGEITVTKSYHKIATEGAAATDDLDTILGGVDGMVVVFRANHTSRTTVFKHNTGNMHLDGSADFSLDNTSDTITLIYDGTLSKWLELSRSNNGT